MDGMASVDPGTTFGPTAWRTVTQGDIDTFARLSGDAQWIHTDVERARRESPFGGTIAHGNLTLALVDGFRDELLGAAPAGMRLGVNLGYDRVRFPAPVPAGADVRATMEVVDARELPGGWIQLVQRFTVEVRGAGKPACVADSVVRALRA
jgi:acyl dehydratase